MDLKQHQKIQGFSLIELIIVIAITAILIGISLPLYTNHVTKTHRQEAQAALINLVARMEQYFFEKHTYVGAAQELLNNNKMSTHYYELQISNATGTTYLLKAIPQNSQVKNDYLCGTLTINQLGEKSITPNNNINNCW